VEVQQDLPALVLRQVAVNDGSGDVVFLERCGHLLGVRDVDTEDHRLLAIKGKIQVGGARYSRVLDRNMGTKAPNTLAIIGVFASVLKRPRTPRFSSRKNALYLRGEIGGKEGRFETASVCAPSIETSGEIGPVFSGLGLTGSAVDVSNTDCGLARS
jgi:hypothetical protein